MPRKRHTLGPLIGYHGCDRSTAESVLSGGMQLRPSANDYDWLGPGIYFWVDSPERGLDWAEERVSRAESGIKSPYVIGALIHPQLCLNLTDYGVIGELQEAYEALRQGTISDAMPKNTVPANGIYLRRALDCAVINTMHHVRRIAGYPAYDTVYGLFEEGDEMYPGSSFRCKTHVQVAVRNPECIVGYFRVF